MNAAPTITSVGPASFVLGTGGTYTITTTGTPTVNSITLTGCALQTEARVLLHERRIRVDFGNADCGRLRQLHGNGGQWRRAGRDTNAGRDSESSAGHC